MNTDTKQAWAARLGIIRVHLWLILKTSMRLKLALVILYAVAVVTPGALLAEQGGSQRDCENQPGKCDDVANQSKKLDLQGWRGVVCFRHKTHESFPNPDTAFAHQAEKGAECVSCHHSRSEATGTPLLWKCTACHRGAGDPQNPRNREMDEVSSERAFHDLCIGCHRASNEKGLSKCKAPIACSECHASRY